MKFELVNTVASYLNATLECTTEGDPCVTEQAIKRDIRSYGIISIIEERVEYIGSSADASFVLFDASTSRTEKNNSGHSHLPVIENSELNKRSDINQQTGFFRENLSDKTDPRSRQNTASTRTRSRSPHRDAQSSKKHFFNSTQQTTSHLLG